MPPAIYTQNTIAFIWDFDKTLIHGYMQDPLFLEYGVNALEFWQEVNALTDYYEKRGVQVGKDTAYLNHILTYVEHGKFDGLNNAKLKELGAQIEFAPGIPDFLVRSRDLTTSVERYLRHELRVEHYIVSTGLRQMIEGSAIRPHVEDVWACELLPDPAPPGYLSQLPTVDAHAPLHQIGYTIDNTSKTRAVFEINKGVNKQSTIDVNSVVPEDQRRVPIRNMIYIADGPSDVPCFSVVNKQGGKTLAVYAPGDSNYENAAMLEEQGRVNSIAPADFSEGSAADRWLMRSLRKIADEICEARERLLGTYAGAPGHVTG
jgi:hypothetical protein